MDSSKYKYHHYLDQNGVHYFLTTPDSGWMWSEEDTTVLSFYLATGPGAGDQEISRWGKAKPRKLCGPDALAQATPPIPVLHVRTKGRGYSGGHNTATRLGWSTSYPKPQTSAILWWDDSTQGRFTGYCPAIVSLIPIPDPDLEHAARDVFEKKPGAFRRLKEACRK